MAGQPITIPSDGVDLVARVFRPQGTPSSGLAVVLSHPHTKFGGSKSNMVGIARKLAQEHQLPCVAFDWRGAGQTGGSSSWFGSKGEYADCRAVCRWALDNLSAPAGCVLVGSSGGAPIAGRAVPEATDAGLKVVAYVGIGYCFGFLTSLLWGHHYQPILQWNGPKLFIMGSQDEHTSVSQLQSKAAGAKGTAEVIIVEGVGHYQLEQPSYDGLVAGHIASFCTKVAQGT
mmetsp:Transcript_31240/g.57130  ORF Transcript_31240/g.57130 Transcript_31240/m.57130 type:complete len:230 (+) Transcript_31240:71-760(+)